MVVVRRHSPGSSRLSFLRVDTSHLCGGPALNGPSPRGPRQGRRHTQTPEEFGNFEWLNAGVSPWVSLLQPGSFCCDLLATLTLSLPCPFWASTPQVLVSGISCEPLPQTQGNITPPVPSPFSYTHRASCIIDLLAEPGWPEPVPKAPVGTAAGPGHVPGHLFSHPQCLSQPVSCPFWVGGRCFSGAQRTL